MDGPAVNAIRDLVIKSAQPVVINGKTFCATPLQEVRAPKPAQPAPLELSTLSSLVEYIRSDRDRGYDRKRLVVHVTAPDHVDVIGELDDEWKVRTTLALASYDPVVGDQANAAFDFEDWYTPEAIVIALQVAFADGGDKANVIRTVGNLQEGSAKTSTDDGRTQTVTTKQGVATLADTPVVNPVVLHPRRSFTEVDQVPVPAILRFRGGGQGQGLPQVALFECDGGAWKVAAVEVIKAYLKDKLKDTGPLVIG